MPDFSADRSLMLFLLLNVVVFGSAYLFASRRMKSAGSQALLDAALLGYAVQYAAIGIPGSIRCLHLMQVIVMAGIFSAGLFISALWSLAPLFGSFDGPILIGPAPIRRFGLEPVSPVNKRWLAGIALFVIAFVLGYVQTQAYLPVISNDAMTYHFPAAAQWLQRGRIDLLQTWFFNPANTYSPLAGSIFITWLILPFGTDVIARFVEVPAVLLAGLAMYKLCRVLRLTDAGDRSASQNPVVAALIAAAAVFSRPIFMPCMMGKDDLFVAFFFITALIALSPEPSRRGWGPVRLGISVGLLLATKYTALLCAPILLLAIDLPRWRGRQWMTAIIFAGAIAGPWYFRNLILRGNPLFPLEAPHLFHGLFTTAHSRAFELLKSAMAVVIGGAYGLPIAVSAVLALAWFLCCIVAGRAVLFAPLLRTCVMGSALGIAIFFWRSPFPEVRFLLPVFLMLFACLSVVVQRICGSKKMAIAVAGLIVVCSVLSLFGPGLWLTTARFTATATAVAAVGSAAQWWAGPRRLRWALVGGVCAIVFGAITYIDWAAYSRDYADDSAYDREYPDLNSLWRFVNEKVPIDATVAYTNLYLVYPLQGRSVQRRLVYAPTRPNIHSVADLGWLGGNLSGEQLIPAAVHATIASPDRSTWLANLRVLGAGYLVVGRGGVAGIPPEQAFAAVDRRFQLIFEGPAGWVYRILKTSDS